MAVRVSDEHSLRRRAYGTSVVMAENLEVVLRILGLPGSDLEITFYSFFSPQLGKTEFCLKRLASSRPRRMGESDSQQIYIGGVVYMGILISGFN
jgi:hypothetical protein